MIYFPQTDTEISICLFNQHQDTDPSSPNTIAPGVDFATTVALRRMATSTGVTPAYLLAPEVSALLFYMPEQRHHMLFATMWNTDMRIGEEKTLTPESFDMDGLRPFVRGAVRKSACAPRSPAKG
jgi:hypothetical protein